jgi:ribosome biogenesis GTPase
VDRYLISAREGGLQPVLVLNKVDLVEQGEAAGMLRLYEGLGFPALAVSASTGRGLDDLAAILTDRTSVFSGQSGVGKSTLLNRLAPGLEIHTREVYGRAGKGRHTTSASTLYHFPFGGAVVDTPGIRSFSLHEPGEEALRDFFPEIFAAAERCRFANCAHAGDDGCAVPAAIESGGVLAERLESFLVLMAEIRGG